MRKSHDSDSPKRQQKKYTIIPPSIRSTNSDAIVNLQDASLAASFDPTTRNSFILLLASQFILFLGVGAVIPIIPLYSEAIGLSGASNGVIISAPALSLLLCSRFSSRVADKARKPPMLLGMFCIALSDLGTGVANSFPSLFLARLGLGLGRGFSEAGERGMLADLANRAPDNWRGKGLALQQACIAVGVACGAPVGGLLVEKFGVRSGFFCVSAAAGICLAFYACLPETVTNTKDDMGKSSTKLENGDRSDWFQLLKTSATWRSLAFCHCGVSFGYACKITSIPIIAADCLPGGVAGAGLLLSAAGLTGLLGASLGGVMTDQFGSRFTASSAGVLSGVSFVLVPFGLSLNKTADSFFLPETVQNVLAKLGGLGPALFVLLVLVWSIGASAQGPALAALAQQEAPAGREATAIGLPRAFGDGTYIIAPFILGSISDAVGDSVVGVACGVAGIAICLGSIALLVPPLRLHDYGSR